MEDKASAENNSRPENCGVCPFTLLPRKTLQRLLKPPFRKRHPLLFTLILCLIAGVAWLLWQAIDSEESGAERLALVNISGPIMDVAPTLAWIRSIAANPSVKGVLLRVDSPGGGAAASQEVYAALERLGQKVPIAASMGATAASGGLMVSMAAQRIFANPSTVTGSIGVRMDVPQLQGLMEKVGIGQETLVTAPFKNAVSYTKAMTPQDRAYLEKVLMDMHEQFVSIVAKGRGMTHEQASSLANGKIFTGQEAQSLGLVDEMGGWDVAHAWLAEKAAVPVERKLLTMPVSRTRLIERLLGMAEFFGLDRSQLFWQADKIRQPLFLY